MCTRNTNWSQEFGGTKAIKASTGTVTLCVSDCSLSGSATGSVSTEPCRAITLLFIYFSLFLGGFLWRVLNVWVFGGVWFGSVFLPSLA